MVKTGDVFAITTSKGEAYFQYVGKMPLMGPLIRVLPGTYPSEVPPWETLVERETNFWVFFPVGAALKRGLVRKVKNCAIPEHAKSPPVFRAGVVDPATGKVETWWLWDGEKEWPVGEISAEQRKLPIRGAWNDTLLIQRIEEGWLPEKDPH
jgi:hypothetical protein